MPRGPTTTPERSGTGSNLLFVFYSLLVCGGLAYLLFVESLPYIFLVPLPIAVLGPLALLRPKSVFVYLQMFLITALFAVRVLLDLWLPVNL